MDFVSGIPWSEAEIEQLRVLYQSGVPVKEIAYRLSRSPKAVKRKLERLGIKRQSLNFPPVFDKPLSSRPLRIVGNCAVTSDWHVPYHDQKLAHKLFEVCSRERIRKLVIAGDFLDFNSLSPFLSCNRDLNTELEKAGILLEKIASFFEEVYLLPGNHEFRLSRKLETPLSFNHLVRMLTNAKNIVPTDYDFIELISGEKRWRICHPRNYSQIKCRVAYRLAAKFECNIIAAHGHFFGLTVSESGKYLCIDSGGLFDINLIEYYWNTTTFPAWNQGFVVIRDGFPLLFSPLLGNV